MSSYAADLVDSLRESFPAKTRSDLAELAQGRRLNRALDSSACRPTGTYSLSEQEAWTHAAQSDLATL